MTQLQQWVDEILAKQVPTTPITVTRGIHPEVWKDLKKELKQAAREGVLLVATNVRVA